MKAQTTTVLAILLTAMFLLVLPAGAQEEGNSTINNAIEVTIFEGETGSVSDAYFPQGGNVLFEGGSYDLWVDERPTEDQRDDILISVGLILSSDSDEMDLMDAIWVVSRESAEYNFAWTPFLAFDPDEDPLQEGEYSMVVIVDYGNPTYKQDQFWSEEFYLLSG